jgi:BirA family transcriptional regulator, biotin operon repressor / biotin---[acetyl-CoA-carboxylase] ligase
MMDCPLIEMYLQKLTRLAPRSRHLNFKLHGFEEQASTNRTAWELIQLGAGEGTVAIAAKQTSGRGQWGRQWQSDWGGVYLSLVLCPSLNSQDAPQLTMAAGWGIAESLNQHQIPAQLKWPNDVVLCGQKLGGILTETRVTHQQIDWAVVGVGLNGFNPVPPTGINLQAYLAANPILNNFNAICLNPEPLSLEAIAAIVLDGLNLGYSRLQQDGIESLLADYEALLIHIGHRVHLEGQMGSVIGVTPQGKLRVQLRHGVQAIEPGGLQFGYPNPH